MENGWGEILTAEQSRRETKRINQQEFLGELKTIVNRFDNSNIDKVRKTIVEIQLLLERFPRNIK